MAHKCNTNRHDRRYLLILLTVMLVGTVGAFFPARPNLTDVVVSVMMIGPCSRCFWLGVHFATPRAQVSDPKIGTLRTEWTLSEHAR